jgi:hypothetical protein
MAIWHFRIGFVPRRAVQEYYGTVPIAIPPPDVEEHDFWKTYDRFEVEVLLSSFGPKINSWSDEITSWGTENGHQISLIGKAGKVEWLTAKIDARQPSADFLGRVVDVAIQLNCLLLLSETYVSEPEYTTIAAHLRSSLASQYLADPGGTLRRLPKPNEQSNN